MHSGVLCDERVDLLTYPNQLLTMVLMKCQTESLSRLSK